MPPSSQHSIVTVFELSTAEMKKAGKVGINVTLRYVRVAIVVEKQQLVTYSECVSVTLVIQRAVSV
jgi:hypothetical protein